MVRHHPPDLPRTVATVRPVTADDTRDDPRWQLPYTQWAPAVQDLVDRGDTMALLTLADKAHGAAVDAIIANCGWTVLWRLGRRSDLTQDQYANLYSNQNIQVQAVVASNPAVGEELLTQIHQDVRRAGRWWWQLAANPNLPRHLHPEYVTSPDKLSRQSYATNPAATPELLETLVEDETADVRAAATSHPNLDLDTLRQIVKRLCENGSGSGEGGRLDSAQTAQLYGALRNPNTDADSLIRIAKAYWQQDTIPHDPNDRGDAFKKELLLHDNTPTWVRLCAQLIAGEHLDGHAAPVDAIEAWGLDEEVARVGTELLEDGWQGTLDELHALLTS